MTGEQIRMTVYGEPTAKGRPKVRVRGRFAQMYTPAKTRAVEDTFLQQIIQHKPETPWEGPLSLTLIFYKPKPKSMAKKVIHWTKRPDLDNMEKLAMDAMDKVFYVDDAQIVEKISSKQYDDTPRTEIIIRKL